MSHPLTPAAIAHLHKVCDSILAAPENFDIDQWGSITDEGEESCKTIGCIAGWVCLNSSLPRSTYASSYTQKGWFLGSASSAAIALLGLDFAQSQELFYFEGWPTKYQRRYYGKDAAGRAQIAVARIHDFIHKYCPNAKRAAS